MLVAAKLHVALAPLAADRRAVSQMKMIRIVKIGQLDGVKVDITPPCHVIHRFSMHWRSLDDE